MSKVIRFNKGDKPKPDLGKTLDTLFKNGFDVNAMYDSIPAEALIYSMNGLLEQFKRRGIKIIDWDHKDKSVKEVRRIGSQIYFLVTGDDDE